MTLPPQSCEISSTNFWPKPVEPRGFGAATTQPCAAQSAGFHRYDHASSHAPCGPPWMRNTTGYFVEASKFGGLISQYLDRRAAGAGDGQRSRACRKRDLFQPAVVFVRQLLRRAGCGRMRNSSAGAVSVDFEKTAKSGPSSRRRDRAALRRPLRGRRRQAGRGRDCRCPGSSR